MPDPTEILKLQQTKERSTKINKHSRREKEEKDDPNMEFGKK
jgi:hypothetical protein